MHGVRLLRAGPEVAGGVGAVPDHAVAPAGQVAADVVAQDLDRIGVGEVVIDKGHVAADVVPGEAEPARAEPFDRDVAADGGVLVVAVDGRPEGGEDPLGCAAFAGALAAIQLPDVAADGAVVDYHRQRAGGAEVAADAVGTGQGRIVLVVVEAGEAGENAAEDQGCSAPDPGVATHRQA